MGKRLLIFELVLLVGQLSCLFRGRTLVNRLSFYWRITERYRIAGASLVLFQEFVR
jgi:hypothetical protein